MARAGTQPRTVAGCRLQAAGCRVPQLPTLLAHGRHSRFPCPIGRELRPSACVSGCHWCADCPGAPLVAARQQTELTLTWAPPTHDGAPPPRLLPLARPHACSPTSCSACAALLLGGLLLPAVAGPSLVTAAGLLACLPACCNRQQGTRVHPAPLQHGRPPCAPDLQAAAPSPPTGWRCAAWAALRGPLAMRARARPRWTRALSWRTWGRSTAQVGGSSLLGGSRAGTLQLTMHTSPLAHLQLPARPPPPATPARALCTLWACSGATRRARPCEQVLRPGNPLFPPPTHTSHHRSPPSQLTPHTPCSGQQPGARPPIRLPLLRHERAGQLRVGPRHAGGDPAGPAL